ncbi:80 kD MCM3-associated protein (GANP/Nin1/mts3/eIF-3 p25 family protein) [Phlyctema vagabunda]|uniref:80 kD MCM3-associated protein (GANP/Nin1/mts3/eIF-3 p25 family protein) n=1 Tax=Phlyctema vagabunda TaxID=108571 RepID=A0ABR4PRH7_9HELO
MLFGRGNSNNSRGAARGQSSTRSRGTRGRGTTSRGALGSSKNFLTPDSPSSTTPSQGGPKFYRVTKTLYDKTNTDRGSNRGTGGYKGRKFNPNYQNRFKNTKAAPAASTKSTNPFEQERLDNAAKREQRGQSGQTRQNGIIRGGSGGTRGKSVKFDSSTKSSSRESSPANSKLFGNPSTKSDTTPTTNFDPFGTKPAAPSTNSSVFGVSSGTSPASNPFASPAASPFSSPSSFATTSSSAAFPAKFPSSSSDNTAIAPSSFKKNNADMNRDGTNDVQQLLRSRGIIPPAWPKDPGNPKQKSAMETIYHAHKAYQAKARTCLIQAGKLDDPDVRKTLAEAIDFRGTCEEMCPEFEKITRIVEHDVPNPEKDDAPDGTRWPAPHKMIKALARSAAGQDAPLPEQVRTPAALRRTFDYLIHTVLGEEGDLRNVHGYLWDRTRAIRRDFVFQQASMTPDGLRDYVYCLEGITRFHAVALHQMSRLSNDGIAPEDFSEHQELEQLGKTLISLFQAYEDCNVQGVECENENEFRAYYILNNSHASGILETVQDWGFKYWASSEEIKLAVQLVELLQNTWDTRGPLKPHSASEVALNSFSRFFTIVSDRSTSYIMACLAETKFNEVRKAALKTILSAYRKQRDQTKDWTLSTLNEYLYFDDEEDIIPFGEAYGLQFNDVDGECYLSFDSDEITDPFPQYKQPHSEYLVESKRGHYSLPQVIDNTVYDESEDVAQAEGTEDKEEDMFIRDEDISQKSSETASTAGDNDNASIDESGSEVNQATPIRSGLFERITAPTAQTTPDKSNTVPASAVAATASSTSSPFMFGTSPNTKPPTVDTGSAPVHQAKLQPKSFAEIFQNRPTTTPGPVTTISSEQKDLASSKPQTTLASPETSYHPPSQGPQSSQPLPSFSFGTISASQPAPSVGPSSPLSLGQHAVTSPGNSNKPPIFGNHAVSSPAPETPAPASPFTFGNHAVQQPAKPDIPISQSFSPLPSPFAASNNNIPAQTQTTPSTTNAQKPSFQFPSTSDSVPMPSETTTLANPGTTPPSTISQKAKMDGFSDWFASGKGGIIDQFQDFAVGQILRHALEVFKKEEKKRLAAEAAAEARHEADMFRYKYLAAKYGQMWRDGARLLWLKRRGRAARKARQEMAEKSFRASQTAKSVDVVEQFRVSTTTKSRTREVESRDGAGTPRKSRRDDAEYLDNSRLRKTQSIEVEAPKGRSTASKKRRNSLESLLNGNEVANEAHHLDDRIRKIVQEENSKTKNKRHKATRSSDNLGSSSLTRSQQSDDNPLRRSILSDPSYLGGGSRILLMDNYGLTDNLKRQVSGVKTDYFRLKARGITTMPDGTPLANSVAKTLLRHKKSSDGIPKAIRPKASKSQPLARSVPANLEWEAGSAKAGEEFSSDIQALKARARAVMEDDKESRQLKRKSRDFEEEELFAKARRIREQMDEGAEWYRKEIERSGSASSP